MVESHKYLGAMFDNKLSFKPNVDSVPKNIQEILYYVTKMNSWSLNYNDDSVL